ncbi:MAG: 16S rRNA (cytosine(1402)-N(4))-methyltransferase RsmH [Candidatus Omnitrophica bacterium]|nr:16S rRNA (cytosine(1402)-N(4))-methyltransferase RsmH [Candidatus Omnitrophota bacterium]MDD4012728.1 16S rRNA (cytosine(1402)-N(4))-methyltransferase RsmH [Candidatus Omnitrophota bacterium]
MHFPVMLKECLDGLSLVPGDVVLDATAGGGGHSEAILEKISPGGHLIAIDRDPEAAQRVKERLEGAGSEVVVVNDNFRNVDAVLESLGIEGVDGALFDLGVSSFQVDDAQKGFSFIREGPLDMRFDPGKGIPAADVVNTFRQEELADIIFEYGEERHSRRIAAAICDARRRTRISTTKDLAEIVARAAGARYKRYRLHPAARTFQALRIFVNDELDSVEDGVKKALSLLNHSGRICVISFHSLEDRIIKNIFRDASKEGLVKLVNKKPLVPAEEEMVLNPRSRSAKLRVAERTI